MNRRGVATCLVVLTTSAAVLSGCRSSDIVAVDDEDGHRLLTHAGGSDASADALVHGILALSADSCLGLGSASDFTVILFPRGTDWSRSGTVTINGQSHHVGDDVKLGGGVNDDQETRTAIKRYCPTALHDVWDTS